GTQMMALAERVAAELGVNEMRLYTNARFTENIVLYEKLGYASYDRVVIPGAGEAVWMRKHLDAETVPGSP
ncbi:MAG: GNAT family N-acetyltransferase, partial [Reyranellaceae bacterium]